MTATPSDTLTDAGVRALDRWVREREIGSGVSAVEPLTGGTQNIVVRLTVDDRTLVLRRPPLHPRSNSNRTMQREIAVLTTLAGSSVPHPRFVAGCEDLDVLGVVFYVMEDVDGFNPGTEVADAYVRDAGLRHQVGLNYAADLARLGNAAWRGLPLEALQRPGSFLARQVPQFQALLESYRHDRYRPDELPDVGRLADWLESNRPPDGEPGIMHGDAHLNNVLLHRDSPRWRRSSTGRCPRSVRPAAGSGLDPGVLARDRTRSTRTRTGGPRRAAHRGELVAPRLRRRRRSATDRLTRTRDA